MTSIATTFKTSPIATEIGLADRGLTASVGALLRRITGRVPEERLDRDPIREAAEVREMANSIRESDPRFASDLYAAADRHERLHALSTGPTTDAVRGQK